MGLNLRRISFTDWAESAVWESYLNEFYKEIEESVGNKLPYNEWTAILQNTCQFSHFSLNAAIPC
ncbi:MAG: hypothetical protein GY795_23855 [Desulfobacterales bacterium]|nr:hypothetical protein [Desulfobacterales bacterium]